MWQPIETAPKDQFLLLCGLSGYTTTPMVITTGRMCSDYHAGRWIDHANDDLTDWGFEPTHWAPLILPGAQPAPSALAEAIIADMQAQHDSELITENDSGEALIRLDGAIAAVEDNFAQPAPSIPEGWKLVPTAESRHPGIYKMLGALHTVDNTPGASEWESYAALLAAAPEAKP